MVEGNITLLDSSQLSFQLRGLTQGSQYGYLNVNGTLAIGAQLVVSFVSGFQNVLTSNDEFTLLSAFATLAPAVRST